MNAPNTLAAPAQVAVPVSSATAATEILPSANRYRAGVLIANGTGGDLFVRLQPKSDSAPTLAQVATVWSYKIPSGSTLPVAAGALTAVYLAAASAGTANVQEIG